jgi:alkanesulfonate monooxygenase SsuD/methylene tetrahydromethanopterin reductase-like flavin-dependent oxidoreductase (luciferase family)
MLAQIKETWEGDEVGPSVAAVPRLILGGHAAASFARAARFGDGWIAAGSGPDQFREGAEKAKAAWLDAGREGAPHTAALAYFSLGEQAAENARGYLGDYYAWLGDGVAAMIVASAAQNAESVQQQFAAYEEAGCDELIFCPSSNEAEQVDLLAEAVGL